MIRARSRTMAITLWLAASILPPAPAEAGDGAVRLAVPAPVRAGIAAFPQIRDPADGAEARINAAVKRLDAAVRNAAAACRDADGKPGTWGRTIDVPMRGPAFISFVITDDTYCAAAYPSTSTTAIVYDLRTGTPVDWTALLPVAFAGRVSLEQGPDGTRMVRLSSKRLGELYLAGYSAADGGEQCAEAVRRAIADDEAGMMAWPDAKGGGLAIRFGLPHVAQACEQAVVIPLATLKAEGVRPDLTDAIAAAGKP